MECPPWTQNTRILRAETWTRPLPALLKPQHDHSHHFFLVLRLCNSFTQVDHYSRTDRKQHNQMALQFCGWSRHRGDASSYLSQAEERTEPAQPHIILISPLFHNETESRLLSEVYSASFASRMGIRLSKTDRRASRL